MATIEEIMQRRRAQGIELRLEPAPAGWRCSVREGGREWSSLRAAHEGFATLLEAVEDVDQRLTELLAARQDARAVQVLARLDQAVAEERLQRRQRQGPGGPETFWVVRQQGGGETQQAGSPSAAIILEIEADAAASRRP